MSLAVMTLMGSGGHIVASRNIYGGTHNLFVHTLPRFGITTTFVDPRNPDEFPQRSVMKRGWCLPKPSAIPGWRFWIFRPSRKSRMTPTCRLLVDATFSTPALLHPFAHGADLIMHSATKWIGGHGVAIGGVLIDSGRFDWEAAGKFPGMTEPYAGFHGLDFAEEFGPAAFVMRARAEGLRDFGACMAPQTAFYLLQGLETLPIRMARHVANAQAVAEFLEDCDEVGWVSYPGLASHPGPRAGCHACCPTGRVRWSPSA